MSSLDSLNVCPNETRNITPKKSEEIGLNKYRKCHEHRRLFESMRFQSPNSDVSSSNKRSCHANDTSMIHEKEKKDRELYMRDNNAHHTSSSADNNGTRPSCSRTSPPVKKMFLV